MLKKIGENLDLNVFPIVLNGGIVMPSKSAAFPLILGEVNPNDNSKRKNRPTTKSRKRTSRWERKTRRQRKTDETSQFIDSKLKQKYLDQLVELKIAYPDTDVWQQDEGLLILCKSALLEDNLQSAIFLCAIPYTMARSVRSWGFWNENSWIGPRHTNPPDGSICGFEPRDNTWLPGHSLVDLIDIYSLWAVRHLHLEKYNRWPGTQFAHSAYERLTELKETELCGCGSHINQYGKCCYLKDIKRNLIKDSVTAIVSGDTYKKPPSEIVRFIKERTNPPQILDLISKLPHSKDISYVTKFI